MTKYCIKCGKSIDESNKFCISCGTKIENEYAIKKSQTQNTNHKSEIPLPTSKKFNIKILIGIISIIIILVVISLVVFLVINTEPNTTPIGNIINNEDNYLGKEVTVKGKVALNTDINDDFFDVMTDEEQKYVLGFQLLGSVDKSVFQIRPNGWIGSSGPYYFTGIVKTSTFVPTDNQLYIECSKISKA